MGELLLRKVLVLSMFGIISTSLLGQNLLINGNFEDTPIDRGQWVQDGRGWESSNKFGLEVSSRSSATRGMWAWKIDSVLNVDSRERLFEVCERHNVSVIYLCTGRRDLVFDDYQHSYIKDFLVSAHSKGMKVHGLAGDPSWILPEKHFRYIEALNTVIDYNQSVSNADEKFDGFQSDVEPHKYIKGKLAPETMEGKLNNINNFIAVHEKGAGQIQQAGLSADFKYGIALFSFYDNRDDTWHTSYNGEKGNVLFHLKTIFDYFAVMSYRDSGEGVINYSKGEIQVADETEGLVAYPGVETQQLLPETVSFYEEGLTAMNEALETVIEEFQDNEGFAGINIHAYDGLIKLIENDPKSYETNVFKGTKSLRIIAGRAQSVYQRVSLKPSTTYAFSFSARIEDAAGSELPDAKMVFSLQDQNNRRLTFNYNEQSENKIVIRDHKWKRFCGEFITPVDLSSLKFNFYKFALAGESAVSFSNILIDNCVLKEVSTGVAQAIVADKPSDTALPNVMAYPNPFNDFITVTSDQTMSSLVMISAAGNQIRSYNNIDTPSYTFSTCELPNGIYVLKIETKNGDNKVIKLLKK